MPQTKIAKCETTVDPGNAIFCDQNFELDSIEKKRNETDAFFAHLSGITLSL